MAPVIKIPEWRDSLDKLCLLSPILLFKSLKDRSQLTEVADIEKIKAIIDG